MTNKNKKKFTREGIIHSINLPQIMQTNTDVFL